jgi:hypothetical protein
VIAVQTPQDAMTMMDMHHRAYIAYDTTQVQANSNDNFVSLTEAPAFQYLEIGSSVEISVVGHPPATPRVDATYYQSVIRKDAYWPEATNKWNRDYVPVKGGKPKPSAVKFYMRFGNGMLSAGRISQVKWEFMTPSGSVYSGNFAEEVVYTFPEAASDVVTLEMRALGDPDTAPPVRTLRFWPLQAGAPKLTLFLGNNEEHDIASAVKRLVVTHARSQSDHFKYLNAVADSTLGMGPIPKAINPPNGGRGGGYNNGPCGPGSGNN